MLEVQQSLRNRIIEHILFMKKHDIDYARQALRTYAEQMPWMDLVAGIKAEMEKQ